MRYFARCRTFVTVTQNVCLLFAVEKVELPSCWEFPKQHPLRSRWVWTGNRWGTIYLHEIYVSDPGEGVKGEDLSRKQWTTLNRLRTGVGRYKASMKKWGLADSAACECGEPEQTADHIINSCPLHRPPSEAGIFEVGPLTRAWLQQTELTIWSDTMIHDRRRRYCSWLQE